MEDQFQRVTAWVKSHPWLAAGILGAILLLAYLAVKNGWFGGGGGSTGQTVTPSPDSGAAVGGGNSGDTSGSTTNPPGTGGGSALPGLPVQNPGSIPVGFPFTPVAPGPGAYIPSSNNFVGSAVDSNSLTGLTGLAKAANISNGLQFNHQNAGGQSNQKKVTSGSRQGVGVSGVANFNSNQKKVTSGGRQGIGVSGVANLKTNLQHVTSGGRQGAGVSGVANLKGVQPTAPVYVPGSYNNMLYGPEVLHSH